jgi:transcriptional regulator with XRE-family HTH domain
MRQRLRTVRNNMGMSQQAMADMLGISLRYYQRIEAGGCVGSFEIWDALEDITGIHQRILRETDRTEE